MSKIPTDLQLLNAIYKEYRDEFENYSDEAKNRLTKIYLPIDCSLIAKKLKVDGDMVFGRLYYDLENRYGYKKANNSDVHFFALSLERDGSKEKHCINFPLMSSVLAGLQHENSRFKLTTWISIIALIVSCVALGTTLVSNTANKTIQPTAERSG